MTRSTIDKLGVKPDARISVVALTDRALLAEISARCADTRAGRGRAGSDLILYECDRREKLDRLKRLRTLIVPNGAIWVLWPKGSAAIKRGDVFTASAAAGLVDVKVASISDRLSGLKLVIPVAQR